MRRRWSKSSPSRRRPLRSRKRRPCEERRLRGGGRVAGLEPLIEHAVVLLDPRHPDLEIAVSEAVVEHVVPVPDVGPEDGLGFCFWGLVASETGVRWRPPISTRQTQMPTCSYRACGVCAAARGRTQMPTRSYRACSVCAAARGRTVPGDMMVDVGAPLRFGRVEPWSSGIGHTIGSQSTNQCPVSMLTNQCRLHGARGAENGREMVSK